MIVAGLGAGLIQVHASIAQRQMQAINNKRALYIAEAGLSEAFMAVTHGKSGNIGTEEEPALFGNGLFWVEAAEQLDGSVALVSNGLCESGRFSLSMVVKRKASPLAALGFFGAESITVREGARIDGYDSSLGTYESQLDPTLNPPSTGAGARLTSNADIHAEGSGGLGLLGGLLGGGGDATWVYGDAIPGPVGSVLAGPDVLITGSTTPAFRPVEVEPLEVPTDLGLMPPLTASDPGAPVVLTDLDGRFGKVHVESNSHLVLRGPVTIVTRGLIVEPDATLTIDTTGGPVMVYATHFVNLAEGSTLENPTRDPKQAALAMAGTGSLDFDGDGTLEPAVTLDATGEFYGLLYAPHSDLSLPASLRVFGCANAKSIEVGEGAHFSYDVAMTSDGVAVTGLPRLLSWRIVELPDAEIVRRRIDPIRWLRLQGVTPKPSHEAYRESHVHLEYIDNLGVAQIFDGLESAFDWTQVRSVEAMRWAENLGDLATAPTSEGSGGGLLGLLF